MSKKGSFGSLKKEAKTTKEGIDVTEIVNNHLDNYEAKMIEMQEEINELEKYRSLSSDYISEIEALQQNNEQLVYQAALKNQDIETLKQTLSKRNEQVQDLSTKIHELEKQLQTKKPIDDRVTKKPLKNDKVSNMREFALSILDNEGDFFKKIAERFKISKSTAYRYCQDIHKSKKVKE